MNFGITCHHLRLCDCGNAVTSSYISQRVYTNSGGNKTGQTRFRTNGGKTHLALKEFYKGNPEPYIKLYSAGQDVSLLGAQGGISVGSKEVTQHATSRASWFQAGRNVSFKRLVKFSTQDLGYIVEVERFDARVGGTSEVIHVAPRVTTIFRLEKEEWKVVNRQGDPLVSRIDFATYRSLAKHNAEVKE